MPVSTEMTRRTPAAAGFRQPNILDAVPFAQAMGDVIRDDCRSVWRRDSFDGRLEQDGRGGAVYVVVAVDKDGLGLRDGFLDAGDGGSHAEQESGVVQVVERGLKEVFGGNCISDPATQQQSRDKPRAGKLFSELCGSAIDFTDDPFSLSHRSELLVAIVNDQAAEIRRGVHQVLETVVPFRRDFEQEHDSLVGKSELQIAGFANVFQQHLRVVEVELFVVGEGVVAELFEQDGDVGFFEHDLAHGDERRAGGLGVLDEILPAVGIVFFVDDGRHLFGDVARQAAHPVARDERDHVVFDRKQVVRLHP